MFNTSTFMRALAAPLLSSLVCSAGVARADAVDDDLLEYVESRLLDIAEDRAEARSRLRDEAKEFRAAAKETRDKSKDRDKKKELETEIKQLEAQRKHMEWMRNNVFRKQLGTDRKFAETVGNELKSLDIKQKIEEARNDPGVRKQVLDKVEDQVKDLVATRPVKATPDDFTLVLQRARERGNDLNRVTIDDLADNKTKADVKEAKQKVLESVKRAYEKEAEKTPVKVTVAEKNLDGSAAKLVTNIEVKKVDGKDKVELSYDVKAQSDVTAANFGGNKQLYESFASSEERRKYLDSLGEPLKNKFIELDLDGKSLGDVDLKAKFAEAVDESSDKLLMSGKDGALKTGLDDKIEAIGDKNKPGSEIADKEKEKADYDGRDAAEKVKELRAKEAVADWLKNPANNPKDMSKCEVLLAAVKWKDLPADAQEDCADFSPEAKTKLAEQEKKPDVANDAETRENKQAERYSKEFQQLNAYCNAYYQNKAAGSGMKSIVDTIAPLSAGLDRLGTTSRYLGRMLGGLSDPSTQSLLQYFAQLDQQQAAAGMPGGSKLQSVLAEKAREIVGGEELSKEGEDKLRKEREILEIMVNSAGTSLAQINGQMSYDPSGQMSKAIMSDPKFQLLHRYFQVGSSLLAAIDVELKGREKERADNKARKLSGVAGPAQSAHPGGVIVGPSGGGGGPATSVGGQRLAPSRLQKAPAGGRQAPSTNRPRNLGQ